MNVFTIARTRGVEVVVYDKGRLWRTTAGDLASLIPRHSHRILSQARICDDGWVIFYCMECSLVACVRRGEEYRIAELHSRLHRKNEEDVVEYSKA